MTAADVSAIRMTQTVYDAYRATIAKHPPETFAILGGSLDDYRVTDYRFCPPARDARGRLDASRTHINVDAELLNFIIDYEWKPNGKYLIGFWHSHPAGCTRPSIGDPITRQGDVAFLSACLDNDDSPGRNWHTCLCPITTFKPDGSDVIHGWTLSRGETKPKSCPVVIENSSATNDIATRRHSAQVALAARQLRVDLVRELLAHYARETASISRRAEFSSRARADMIAGILRMRDAELADLCTGSHPLSIILNTLRVPPHA